jgi:MFS family permease
MTSKDQQPTPKSRTFAALKHRGYRLFLTGQIISLVGTWIHQTALSWLVYRLTGSAAILGLIGFVGNIPVLILGLFAGALVDRHDRKRIVLMAQIGEMFIAATTCFLTWHGLIQVWHIIGLALLMGIFTAVEVPARQTLFMDLVGREDLPSAIGLNSAAYNTARVVGPVTAGLMVDTFGEAVCFLIDALTFVAVIIALLMIEDLPPPRILPHGTPLAPFDGLRYIFARREMATSLAMIALANLLAIPFHQLLPAFVSRVMNGTSKTLGRYSAAIGVGALIGGLLVATVPPERLSPRVAGKGLLVYSASLCCVALYHYQPVNIALLVLAGLALITQTGTTNNYLQSRAPEMLRGRIVASFTTTFIGLYPIGCLMMGHAADYFGIAHAVAGATALCFVSTLLLYPFLEPVRASADL